MKRDRLDPQALLSLLERRAVGRNQAVKASVLATVLGCSVRDVQAAVESLRRSGVIVGASRDNQSGGLYLPADDAERREAVDRFRRTAMDHILTYQAMRRAFSRPAAQMPLPKPGRQIGLGLKPATPHHWS
jgi:biotin operon repressor